MEIPRFELLEFLLSKEPAAECDLAGSGLPPLGLHELGLPEDLDLSWGHIEGSPELRRLIAQSCQIDTANVLVTQGASEANYLVGLSLLAEGAHVVVERPYYEPLWKTFQLMGGRVSFLPRPADDGFHLPMDRLPELLPEQTTLLVLTNLHNPSGRVTDERGLRELSALAEERGFYILMDEVFREAAFERRPPCALTLSERFIVTSSPSKCYGLGGVRIGWCLAAPDVLQRIRNLKLFTTVAPSTLSDALAVRALQMREAVQSRNRRLIEHNRKRVAEWMAAQRRLEWVPPEGYTSFPHFQGDVNKLASVAFNRYGTLIAPGQFFGDATRFRLCFGMETAVLEAGLERLAQAIRAV